MATVSRVAVPIEQAVTADFSVNLGPAGQGLQQLGASLSQVSADIQRREKAAKINQAALDKAQAKQRNTTGNNTVTGLMSSGSKEIEVFTDPSAEPDPDKWAEIAKQVIDKKIKAFSGNEAQMEEEAFKAAQEDLKFWGIEQGLIIQGEAIKARSAIAFQKASAGLEQAVASGNKDAIERTSIIYDDAARQQLTPAQAAEEKRKIITRGEDENVREIQNKYLELVMNSQMTEDQALAGMEILNITREEKSQLGATISKRIKVRDEEREDNIELAQEQNYFGLLEIAITSNLPKTTQLQNAQELFGEGRITKLQWEDIEDRLTVPRKTDPEANAASLDIIYKVGSGAITVDEGKDLLKGLLPLLSDTDSVNRVTDLQKEWNNSHATALDNAVADSKKMHTVQFTSSGIFSNAALEAFFPTSGKSPEEKAEMNKRFLLEQNNISLYNTALRNWYRTEIVKKDLTVQDVERTAANFRMTYERRLVLTTEQLEDVVRSESFAPPTTTEPDRPKAETPIPSKMTQKQKNARIAEIKAEQARRKK